MSLSDPIGDMLTRLRNGGKAEHDTVTMPSSKLKAAIAEVLKSTGYISNYSVDGEKIKTLTVSLKYHDGEPVIEGIKRISRPSCRIYVGSADIPRVLGGLGIAILSTSKGVMTGRAAKKEKLGGEILCYVW